MKNRLRKVVIVISIALVLVFAMSGCTQTVLQNKDTTSVLPVEKRGHVTKMDFEYNPQKELYLDSICKDNSYVSFFLPMDKKYTIKMKEIQEDNTYCEDDISIDSDVQELLIDQKQNKRIGTLSYFVSEDGSNIYCAIIHFSSTKNESGQAEIKKYGVVRIDMDNRDAELLWTVDNKENDAIKDFKCLDNGGF